MLYGIDFAIVTTGNPYTVLDAYNASLLNNGAQNVLGNTYAYPATVGLSGSKGQGSPIAVKYVRYLSTANPATVAGPAPVYWTDETYTTVSGVESEGAFGVNGVAGWLLPNTAATGASFTAAALNGNFVFIGVGGYIPACIAPGSTAIGDNIIGASGNFTPARVAAGTATTNTSLGIAQTAIASGVADVRLSPYLM